MLNALAQRVPWLLGGAADLAPSTKTNLTFDGAGSFEAPGQIGDYRGRNFHFGVREHAMVAAVSGMTLCGLRAFGAGFLIFTDYARGAIRLSALMELPVIHVWTHDSIGVGEDGPTHQPIEQLLSLRAIPGMVVIRPMDANETTEAYRVVMRLRDRPAAIICSRQPLPTVDRDKFASAALLAKGAYVLADPPDGKPSVILIGTGSEVSLCMAAREMLAAEGIAARVVSMPSWELFDDQDQAWRDSVLPPSITARVTVEEASPIGWDRYAGTTGVVLGMRSFGLSAPIAVLAEHFGFTRGSRVRGRETGDRWAAEGDPLMGAPSDALVFFGATGDLAYEQIFPSLLGLVRDDGLKVPIIGVAKAGWSSRPTERSRERQSVASRSGR